MRRWCCLLWLLATTLPFLAGQAVQIEGEPDWVRLQRSLARAHDPAAQERLLTKWVREKQAAGWLEYRLDSSRRGDSLLLQVHRGPWYTYDQLQLTGLPPLYAQKSGLERLQRKAGPVDWAELERHLAQCLDLYQQEGYPFAAFRDLRLHYRPLGPDTLATTVHYAFDPGPLVRIDSIRLTGSFREQDRFVYSLMRLAPGDIYQHKRIMDIPRVLNNSIYFQKVPDPEIRFTPQQTAVLTVPLTRRRAGKLDVLLGLLPPSDESQRLQITGTMDILLVSPFRQGEWLSFQYNKLTSTSLQTRMQVVLPYLLGTPVRVEGELELLKQEEAFLNLDYQASLLYAFSPFLSARFFFQERNTRLLDSTLADTSLLQPDQLDGNRRMGGVGFEYERLDYRFNPSQGFVARAQLGLGQQAIRTNVRLPETVYDSLPGNQIARELQLEVQWFQSLWPRHVLHLANRTRWLGMDYVFRNDQWQLGGARSIRGFNENSFFADFYSFFTVEYRFQLERDSYIFAFGDAAYLEDNVRNRITRPTGFGLGMNYGTKAGIISIIYAMGRTADIPLQPARGKIHIGLVNQF